MEYFLSLPESAQTAILGLAATFIVWLFRPKVKLVWSKAHGYCHRVVNDQDSLLVYNDYYMLQNVGRKPAENVEVVFNFRPEALSVWPQRSYTTTNNPEGRYILSFEYVAAKELLNINLLTIGGGTPSLIAVRNAEHLGKEIQTHIVRKYSGLVVLLIFGLLIAGTGTFLKFLISWTYLLHLAIE